MRDRLITFTEQLEQATDYSYNIWQDRLSHLRLEKPSVSDRAELMAVLFGVASYVSTGNDQFLNHTHGDVPDYGILVTKSRFEVLFGNRQSELLLLAKRGGLRKVMNEYIARNCILDCRESLSALVDVYFETEYGLHPAMDYELMHDDGRDYIEHYAEVIPSEILSNIESYIHASDVVRVMRDGKLLEIPRPKLHQLYVKHPEFVKALEERFYER